MRKVKIGIIGCGNVSHVYIRDMTTRFGKWLDVAAAASRRIESAREVCEKFGVPKACTVEELLADPEIEIVVNLTPPAAHGEIDRMILNAGKHLYSEKPFALSMDDAREIMNLAQEKGLMIACAPETFLNGGLQTAIRAMDSGECGRPVLVTANMIRYGCELWHPNPEFFYLPGGGPALDMAPYYITALVALLGPIRRVFAFGTKSSDQRTIYSQPKRGQTMPVEVDTTFAGCIEFASGTVANLNLSFDGWRSDLPHIQIYGTDGTLTVCDPNLARGETSIYRKESILSRLDEWPDTGNIAVKPGQELYETIPMVSDEPREYTRGIGVLDMAFALVNGRVPRANVELVYHVTEAILGIIESAETGRAYEMQSTCARPAPIADGEFEL